MSVLRPCPFTSRRLPRAKNRRRCVCRRWCERKDADVHRQLPQGPAAMIAWAIENKDSRGRDVTYDEDRSQVRTDTGPEVMAAMRNSVIGAIRTAGITTIDAGTRHHARHSSRPPALLGIT
jgi:hypothetical protein